MNIIFENLSPEAEKSLKEIKDSQANINTSTKAIQHALERYYLIDHYYRQYKEQYQRNIVLSDKLADLRRALDHIESFRQKQR